MAVERLGVQRARRRQQVTQQRLCPVHALQQHEIGHLGRAAHRGIGHAGGNRLCAVRDQALQLGEKAGDRPPARRS